MHDSNIKSHKIFNINTFIKLRANKEIKSIKSSKQKIRLEIIRINSIKFANKKLRNYYYWNWKRRYRNQNIYGQKC